MLCFSSAINRLVDNKSLGETAEKKRYICLVRPRGSAIYGLLLNTQVIMKAIINVISLFIDLIKLIRAMIYSRCNLD